MSPKRGDLLVVVSAGAALSTEVTGTAIGFISGAGVLSSQNSQPMGTNFGL
jgi:hypothetical protein